MVHASTEAQENGLICGALDVPLSPTGMKEAKKAAQTFARAKTGVRVIWCSPLLRSIQMADFVHDEIAGKMRVLQALGERRLGIWEGLAVSRVPEFSPLTLEAPGGEGIEALRLRVREAVNEVREQTAPVLIVGHEIFGRVMLSLLGAPDRELSPCQTLKFTRAGTENWVSEDCSWPGV
jgi:broad specificity phosphatase PhoE